MNDELRLAKFADQLTTRAQSQPDEHHADRAATHVLVNGHANAAVYQLLARSDRRAQGVFFSGSEWAQALVEDLNSSNWNRFLDPSAGTGDLLLEICRRLPLQSSSAGTIRSWSSRIAAVDLRESFLRIAWARIQALAMIRHNEPIDENRFLPMPKSFRFGDALTEDLALQTGDCVVMNPPYQRVLASPGSFVGKGSRSAAAIHLERVLNMAPEGVGIVALVPDVLRSGSLYENFREVLGQRMNPLGFEGKGKFGGDADIDVAIIRGVTRSQIKGKSAELADQAGPSVACKGQSIGDLCAVSVGPVVPHRTDEDGKLRGYLTARNSPLWGLVEHATEKARFNARLTHGPFVVVRRTSSPSDKQRARATLVKGKGPWLIENHLLTLVPKKGTIKDCKRVIRSLKDARTSEWLNQRIRCRHLTVGAIATLPIWDTEES